MCDLTWLAYTRCGHQSCDVKDCAIYKQRKRSCWARFGVASCETRVWRSRHPRPGRCPDCESQRRTAEQKQVAAQRDALIRLQNETFEATKGYNWQQESTAKASRREPVVACARTLRSRDSFIDPSLAIDMSSMPMNDGYWASQGRHSASRDRPSTTRQLPSTGGHLPHALAAPPQAAGRSNTKARNISRESHQTQRRAVSRSQNGERVLAGPGRGAARVSPTITRAQAAAPEYPPIPPPPSLARTSDSVRRRRGTRTEASPSRPRPPYRSVSPVESVFAGAGPAAARPVSPLGEGAFDQVDSLADVVSGRQAAGGRQGTAMAMAAEQRSAESRRNHTTASRRGGHRNSSYPCQRGQTNAVGEHVPHPSVAHWYDPKMQGNVPPTLRDIHPALR